MGRARVASWNDLWRNRSEEPRRFPTSSVYRLEGYSAFVRFLVPRVGHCLRLMGLLHSVEFSWVDKIFQGFSDKNPGWIESKLALKAIVEMSRERNAVVIVAIYPLLVELDNYAGKDAHRTVATYCRLVGVDEVVDLLEIFQNKNGRSFWINYMDGHPNEKAHEMVSEALLPVIRQHFDPRIPMRGQSKPGGRERSPGCVALAPDRTTGRHPSFRHRRLRYRPEANCEVPTEARTATTVRLPSVHLTVAFSGRPLAFGVAYD